MKVLQWFREGQDRLPIEIVGDNEKLLITTLAIIANTRRIRIQMTDDIKAGKIRQTTESPLPEQKTLSLDEFRRKLDWLRFKNNYTYTEAQRYFKRVHNIEKDQFEELSATLDSRHE